MSVQQHTETQRLFWKYNNHQWNFVQSSDSKHSEHPVRELSSVIVVMPGGQVVFIHPHFFNLTDNRSGLSQLRFNLSFVETAADFVKEKAWGAGTRMFASM